MSTVRQIAIIESDNHQAVVLYRKKKKLPRENIGTGLRGIQTVHLFQGFFIKLNVLQ